jgi:hypothetical protein
MIVLDKIFQNIDFDLAVHVKPGKNAVVTVTVDTDGNQPQQSRYELATTFDWPLDATVDGAHLIHVCLPTANFNRICIAVEHNDVLVLGYTPRQANASWRFASVPEWRSGQLYNNIDNYDDAPYAMPILSGDQVEFYCVAIASFVS